MASNRVRVAMAHIGGGPVDDAGSSHTGARHSASSGSHICPDSYTGPASDADTVRFLEQASWTNRGRSYAE